jgi:hypothetical protein
VNDERNPAQRGGIAYAPVSNAYLSPDELWRLTLYKWRYTLESDGFSRDQAAHLLFLRWLHSRGAARS